MTIEFNKNRVPTGESGKTYQKKYDAGFFKEFFKGDSILELGGLGVYGKDSISIHPEAINLDLNYPGYDGTTIPFQDETFDAVYSSHVLEHVSDEMKTIQEMFRVLKINGFLIIVVPHMDLYEKKKYLPSRFSDEHLRFYNPEILLHSINNAICSFEYRLRYLADEDLHFDYDIDPYTHSSGTYEFCLVIEKIPPYKYRNIINEETKPDYLKSNLDNVYIKPYRYIFIDNVVQLLIKFKIYSLLKRFLKK